MPSAPPDIILQDTGGAPAPAWHTVEAATAATIIVEMAIVGAKLLLAPAVAEAFGDKVIVVPEPIIPVPVIARAMDSDRRTAVTACCEVRQR